MRVTHLSRLHSSLDQVTGRLGDFDKTQQRLGSGKRMLRISDDPTGMSRALELRAALISQEQQTRNADDGEMWLNLTDARLRSFVDQLQRARELAVRGATFSNATERAAIAAEISELRNEIVALANSVHQGRSLFAGFSAGDAVQKVAGAWVYQGDTGQVDRRISGQDVVTVNITGDVAFGFTAGKDVFTVLDDFEAALLAGDTAAVGTAIAEVDGSIETVLVSLATAGAAASRLETVGARNAEEVVTLRTLLSDLEDVDIAEAMMELRLQQTGYEAALAAFSRSSQSSLVDFLR